MKNIVRLIASFFLLIFIAPGNAQEQLFNEESGVKYRLLGPVNGGRASRVAGIPGDPLTYYLATAAGGVWKTINGGEDWVSVFDDQPVSSIGSVAVARGNENIVFVGSGEANIRGNVGEGNGIYRSRDGGETWDHVWVAEGQIGTIAISPVDDDVIFAAALGSPFGAGPDRGILRSTDGGDSWEKVLYVDEDTGASDVAFDESNPNVLFAGMWQTRRYPWDMRSGGPGSGLYMSRDGGDSWTRLEGNGLPEGIWGKVGVRVAPTNADRVYALIEAEAGGLYRSDDGGDTWEYINDSGGLRQRAWYYTTLTIDPNNEEVVWFPQVGMLKTIDGGKSVLAASAGGWDHHDVWIDPENSKRIAEASDAGVSISLDGGKTWERSRIPLGQFYHLSVDTRSPYRVMGSLQDFGTRAGPSNSLHSGGIHLGDWKPVGGGEAGFVVADPEDPQVIYAGEYLGILTRYDERTGQAPHVGIYPDNGSGRPAAELRHRFQWTAPIMISPHDSKLVYHASNFLQRTRDGGQTWDIISPDLTRDDESKQQWTGGPITGDITGVEFYGTIFSVAESPLEQGVIWTGSDDGLVHVTRDDGENWEDVTPFFAPEWATVVTIEASRFDAGKAYAVFDAHRLDDERPYLWKTENYGSSWSSIADGLDQEIYLKVVREDAQVPGLLYLGTERGVMVSHDDGDSWEPLRLNMPTVAIADIAVAGDDLVVGTLGRAAWVLDDLTAVREMSADIANSPAYLFEPLDTVRWAYAPAPEGGATGATENPPRGAMLTYYLADEPDGDISLEILDSEGNIVRTLSSVPEAPYVPADHPDAGPDQEIKADLSKNQGLNRASWDLAHDGPDEIPGATNDAGELDYGPMVVPGKFLVRLNVDGQGYEQPLEVLPDPRAGVPIENLRAQNAYMLAVRDRISSITEDAMRIRTIREQLDAHESRLSDDPTAPRLLELGEQATAALREVELMLYNPDARVLYDILAGRHGGAKLYSRYASLYWSSINHNGPPTQGMTEVDSELLVLYREANDELQRVLNEEIAQINALAAELGVDYVVD